MNNEHMRKPLAEALPYLEAHTDMGPIDEGWKSDELLFLVDDIEQALAAEPAPLVRLTEQDIEKLQHGDITCWNWDDTLVFANAIMDAMLEKNSSPAQQVEPVAWAETDEHGEIAWGEEGCFSNDPAWIENPIPLYTRPAPAVEREPDYWLGYGLQAHKEKPFEGATPVYLAPPSAVQQVEPDFKAAYMEWHDKTEWVQEKKYDWPFPVLGMHRADAMKKYIEHLESNQSAPSDSINEKILSELKKIARLLDSGNDAVSVLSHDEAKQRGLI